MASWIEPTATRKREPDSPRCDPETSLPGNWPLVLLVGGDQVMEARRLVSLPILLPHEKRAENTALLVMAAGIGALLLKALPLQRIVEVFAALGLDDPDTPSARLPLRDLHPSIAGRMANGPESRSGGSVPPYQPSRIMPW
jgi:hypothetical protein